MLKLCLVSLIVVTSNGGKPEQCDHDGDHEPVIEEEHHQHLAMDFEGSDSAFAEFFDKIVIPASRYAGGSKCPCSWGTNNRGVTLHSVH